MVSLFMLLRTGCPGKKVASNAVLSRTVRHFRRVKVFFGVFLRHQEQSVLTVISSASATVINVATLFLILHLRHQVSAELSSKRCV